MAEYKLPRWIQQQCLWIVRGYDQNKAAWKLRRQEILEGGGVRQSSETGGIASAGSERSTEQRAERLAALERTTTFRQMVAVDHALTRVSAGLPRAMGKQLRTSLMINAQNGRAWPYERLPLDGFSRRDFYRIRNRFFYLIAEDLGMV